MRIYSINYSLVRPDDEDELESDILNIIVSQTSKQIGLMMLAKKTYSSRKERDCNT